jgi:hypothetical protein
MKAALSMRAVTAAVVLGLVGAPAWAVDPKAPETFQFALLNRSYSNLAPAAETVTQGPLTVALTSPRQVLLLRENQLTLTPRADGSHDAELALGFLGKGWLVADATVAGYSTRLEDELLLPTQRQALRARVDVERVPGGFAITPRELPPAVTVQIESKLVTGLLSWCSTLSLLVGGESTCEQLGAALTRVQVPLPPVGQPYVLADADLRPSDRDQLEAYLLRAWSQRMSGLPRLNR